MRAEGYTRWRKSVALLAAALLGVTYFLYFCLLVSLGEPHFTLTLTLTLALTLTLTPTPTLTLTLVRRAVLHQPPHV